MARSHLKRVLLACLGALLLSPTFANPGLLPADTVLAVGLEGLSEHEARFRPFIDEFERAGLADSLGRLFGDAADELGRYDVRVGIAVHAPHGDFGEEHILAAAPAEAGRRASLLAAEFLRKVTLDSTDPQLR